MEIYCILICVSWGLSPCSSTVPCKVRWGVFHPQTLLPDTCTRIEKQAGSASAANRFLWSLLGHSPSSHHTPVPAGAGQSLRSAQKGVRWHKWVSKLSLLIEHYYRVELQQLSLKYKRHRTKGRLMARAACVMLDSTWVNPNDPGKLFWLVFLEKCCSFMALLCLGATQSLLSWMRIVR